MSGPGSRGAALALVALIAIGFASPVRGVWARPGGPWWLPFAAWLPAIVGLWWLARRGREP